MPSEEKESVARSRALYVKQSWIVTSSHWGLTLGDLRKLVTASEGMSDDAEVTFEDLRKHYSTVDKWLAKQAQVREEVADAE